MAAGSQHRHLGDRVPAHRAPAELAAPEGPRPPRKLDTLAAALAAQLRHELHADPSALERSARELEAAVQLVERI
jgi:hypothetical protein